jgi:hypothetical protein
MDEQTKTKSIVRTVSLRTTNSPLAPFVHRLTKGELNVDPACQRGRVWGSDRKIALIRSLTMGLPIGSIFIDDRPFPEYPAVIDGKQRILAVADWMGNRLRVPRDWFDDDLVSVGDHYEYVTFDDLSEKGRRMWENQAHAQVYWSDFKGSLEEIEAQELELFMLINFGGVAQGESD